MSGKTIHDCQHADFGGLGTYKLPIEERANEIMDVFKKECELCIRSIRRGRTKKMMMII